MSLWGCADVVALTKKLNVTHVFLTFYIIALVLHSFHYDLLVRLFLDVLLSLRRCFFTLFFVDFFHQLSVSCRLRFCLSFFIFLLFFYSRSSLVFLFTFCSGFLYLSGQRFVDPNQCYYLTYFPYLSNFVTRTLYYKNSSASQPHSLDFSKVFQLHCYYSMFMYLVQCP